MQILIVIVNYRSTDLVLDCLRSLVDEVGKVSGTQVVVTDNASGDDAVARLETAVRESHWEQWVTIQPLEHNGGFAAGNNAAIRSALANEISPRYVVLLNPDTIIRTGAIQKLVDFMERRPEIGIVGSRLENPDGTPQHSAFRFPTVLSELEGGLRFGPASRLLARWAIAPEISPEACPTDWVAGACMIIRREVFNTIGLLDEGYFMYFEEVDFCHRARRAGWSCWYMPDSRVVHLIGRSSGVTDPRTARRRRPTYWFAARRRYFLGNQGRLATMLADIAWTAGRAFYHIRKFGQPMPSDEARWLFWDFIRFNFLLVRR